MHKLQLRLEVVREGGRLVHLHLGPVDSGVGGAHHKRALSLHEKLEGVFESVTGHETLAESFDNGVQRLAFLQRVAPGGRVRSSQQP